MVHQIKKLLTGHSNFGLGLLVGLLLGYFLAFVVVSFYLA